MTDNRPHFWSQVQLSKPAFSTGNIAHGVGAIIICQFVFWSIVLGAIFLSPLSSSNLGRFEVKNFTTSRAISTTTATPIEPWRGGVSNDWAEIQAPTPALFQFKLNVKDTHAGVGVFVATVRDSATLWVNGVSLGPALNSQLTARPGLLGVHFSVPPALLRSGENSVVLFANRDNKIARLGRVFAGPAVAIDKVAKAHTLTKVAFPIIALTICAMLAMVAISLIPLGVERAFSGSSIATAVTLGIGILFYLDTGVFTSAVFWLWYGNVFGAIGGYLAFVCLINAWGKGPNWVYRAAIALFGIIGLGTAVATPFLAYEAVSFMMMISVSAIMAVALPVSLYMLARLMWSPQKGDHWLAAVLVISPITAFVDLVLSVLGEPQVVYFAPLSNLTLILALSFALARRGGVLYRQAQLANVMLTKHIAAKEAELDTSARALRAQEAQTVIQTERARIMRDMHDGMGGQLLNLLIQTRDPEAKREEMEETVETAIADLRLLIDSLDSVGDDLEIALAMFKERLSPRLSSARVTLDWPSEALTVTRSLSAAEILSIYRILQEAISNSLRHAKPKRIWVNQKMHDDTVVITIDDDGPGMAAGAHSGRGLTNMRRRAHDLGGSITIEQNPFGGVRLVFSVPASAIVTV